MVTARRDADHDIIPNLRNPAVSDVNLPELCPSSRNTLDAGKTVLARLKTERGINSDVGATFLKIDNPNVEEWLICARSSPRYVMRFVGLADFYVSETGDVVECCNICDGISQEKLNHIFLDAVIPSCSELAWLRRNSCNRGFYSRQCMRFFGSFRGREIVYFQPPHGINQLTHLIALAELNWPRPLQRRGSLNCSVGVYSRACVRRLIRRMYVSGDGRCQGCFCRGESSRRIFNGGSSRSWARRIDRS
jgi:hypothetical protein